MLVVFIDCLDYLCFYLVVVVLLLPAK